MKNGSNRVRFTYRLSNELFQAIQKAAGKKNISINAEINAILWEHYEIKQKSEWSKRQ